MNTTRGIHRRGNRGGRPIYPAGTSTIKMLITLSRAEWEFARRHGKGYPTHTLRACLRRAMEST